METRGQYFILHFVFVNLHRTTFSESFKTILN
jgi:hypothetical protein